MWIETRVLGNLGMPIAYVPQIQSRISGIIRVHMYPLRHYFQLSERRHYRTIAGPTRSWKILDPDSSQRQATCMCTSKGRIDIIYD